MSRPTAICPAIIASLLLAASSAQADKPLLVRRPAVPAGDDRQRDPAQLSPGRHVQVASAEPTVHGQRGHRHRPIGLDAGTAHRAGARGRGGRLKRLDHNDIASVVIFDNRSTFWYRRWRSSITPPSSIPSCRWELAAAPPWGWSPGRVKCADKDNAGSTEIVLLSDGRANVGPSGPTTSRCSAVTWWRKASRSAPSASASTTTRTSCSGSRAQATAITPSPATPRIWCRSSTEFDDVLASCAQTVSIDIELRRVCAPSAHSAAMATSRPRAPSSA